jgi:arylsulfatase A-like enzyme
MDVHNPYTPPEPWRSQFTQGLRGRVLRRNGAAPDATPADVAVTRARYDGEVRAFDENLKRLYEQLRRAQLLDSTLVVFTADHGEEFHEHGGLGHGWTLFEETVHVPLFFSHPSLRANARRVSAPVSSVDLLPTLLELVGLPTPSGLDGRSLAPVVLGREAEPASDRLLFAELGDVKAVRRGQHKLISSVRPGGRKTPTTRAFDLASDPAEALPLQAAPWAALMHSQLEKRHAATRRAISASGQLPSEDPGEASEPWFEEQLRALGYVE